MIMRRMFEIRRVGCWADRRAKVTEIGWIGWIVICLRNWRENEREVDSE